MTTADSTTNARNTEMTDRQLAATVRYGRLVTFETPDLREDSVTGYVMGFDDDNIRLGIVHEQDGPYNPYIENRAIHRDYIAGINFHERSTISQEPVARELEQQIKKFRTRIVEEYFPDRARP